MLILASTSAARQKLLASAGVAFRAMPPSADEEALKRVLAHLQPQHLAARLARAKAESLRDQHPDATIIGCDQVLSCEGRIYDKPSSMEDAASHLRSLSGKTHVLHTALCCLGPGPTTAFEVVTEPNLTMRPLSETAIQHYLSAAGPAILASVGCYQIESLGLQLFARVEGDWPSIQGLPLLPLLAHLREIGELPV